jgi:nicotinamidase-related amidase
MRRFRNLLGVLLLALAFFSVETFAQEAHHVNSSVEPKSALVVIDAQVGVLGSVWDSKRIIGNIDSLVAKARASGTPVLWVQHSDQELVYGSDDWKLVPNFRPAAADPVVHKKYNSAFAESDLEPKLKELGVRRLVLAGALTNWCLRSTAYSALDRGYDLVIVNDAHSTVDLEVRPGHVVAAKDIVDEFNSVMRWLSVPNVRIESKGTGEVNFQPNQ